MAKPKHPARPSRLPNIEYFVTEELFQAAKRNDSRKCMVAEAIKAGLPGMFVEVDLATTRIDDVDRGIRHFFMTPHIARDAILSFDFGFKFKPFSFRLNGHDWMTAIHKRNSKNRTSLVSWQANTEFIKKIRQERNLTWNDIGKEIGVDGKNLERRISDINHPPHRSVVDAVDEWVVKQTGKPPAPRIQSQADLVRGSARKSETSNDVIGGRPPLTSKSMRYRQFGVRAYDWKPSEEDE